jgi:hypothetical protein
MMIGSASRIALRHGPSSNSYRAPSSAGTTEPLHAGVSALPSRRRIDTPAESTPGCGVTLSGAPTLAWLMAI